MNERLVVVSISVISVFLAACSDSPAKPDEPDGSVSSVPDMGIAQEMGPEEDECVRLQPASVEFEALEVGDTTAAPVTIENCGSSEVEVLAVRIQDEDAPFRVADGDGLLGSLPPGATRSVTLSYEPSDAGEHRSWLLVESVEEIYSVRLDGQAGEVRAACPLPRVTMRSDGAELDQNPSVEYRSDLELDASTSSYELGEIAQFNWTIVDLAGRWTATGTSLDLPTNIVGAAEVTLDLVADDGVVACQTWSTTVTVLPPEDDVFVQLVWSNADDLDPMDDVGSDVDLHFVKMGPGAWFESPYDIFYRNPNNTPGPVPIWEVEDPALTIDDRDGRGPETITMPEADDCEWYALGVHYYRQLFGTAVATVRVFIAGTLVYERLREPLETGGIFVDLARIHWPTGNVYEVATRLGEPPANEAPTVVDDMVQSGLCTDQTLY